MQYGIRISKQDAKLFVRILVSALCVALVASTVILTVGSRKSDIRVDEIPTAASSGNPVKELPEDASKKEKTKSKPEESTIAEVEAEESDEVLIVKAKAATVDKTTQPQTEPETEPETEKPKQNTSWWGGITEDDPDFILICNCVGNEAGADWISLEDKAKVVEVIINWVESDANDFRNIHSVWDAISKPPGGFTGSSNYLYLDWYSSKVTESVKEAVRGYLRGDYPNHGYTRFWGDGRENHFY